MFNVDFSRDMYKVNFSGVDRYFKSRDEAENVIEIYCREFPALNKNDFKIEGVTEREHLLRHVPKEFQVFCQDLAIEQAWGDVSLERFVSRLLPAIDAYTERLNKK